jgi:hypothetical protein
MNTAVKELIAVVREKGFSEIYKDWKNQLLDLLYDGQYKESEADYSSWIESIENGIWNRKMVLGISDAEQGWLVVNPEESSGLLLVGGMGSGKSTSGKFIVATMFASAKGKAIFIFCDFSAKGCADYSPFFKYEECCAVAIYEPAKMIPLFMFLQEELVKRQVKFQNMFQAEKVSAYEERFREVIGYYKEIVDALKANREVSPDVSAKIRHLGLKSNEELLAKIHKQDLLDMTEDQLVALGHIVKGSREPQILERATYDQEFHGVAQVNVLIEEFHEVPMSPEMNFNENQDTHGTIAYIFKKLAKVSRSFGFNFILVNQRAVPTEMPSNIKLIANTVLCHKVGSLGDAQMLNLPKVEEIKGEAMKGRSVYEGGFNQCPFLSKTSLDRLLDRYYVPLKAKLYGRPLSDYQHSFAQSGSDGMCDVQGHEFVVLNHPMFRGVKICEKFFSNYGWELDTEISTVSTEINAVFKKGEKKVGVLINQPRESGRGMGSMQSGPSDKKMKSFSSECEMLKLDGAIYFNLDKKEMSGGRGLGGMSGGGSDNIEKIGFEDLIKAGNLFDNAEETKKGKTYDELYRKLVLTGVFEKLENNEPEIKAEVNHDPIPNSAEELPAPRRRRI